MMQDLTGLLQNAAASIRHDPHGYAHDLRQLAANLHELHREYVIGDSPAALTDFFRIYASSPVTHETWPKFTHQEKMRRYRREAFEIDAETINGQVRESEDGRSNFGTY